MNNKILHFLLILLCPVLLWSQTIGRDYVIKKNKEAAELNREGKFDQAKKVLDDLLEELSSENADERLFATTYQTKAKVVQNFGDYKESTKIARASLLISLRHFDSLNIADSYNTIGINHYFESDYDSTTFYYEKSYEIKKKINTDPYALAVSAYNLALVFDDLGQTGKAMELYKQAEELLIQSATPKNFLSDVYVGMALIYFYGGDLSKAELYAEKAMEKGLISYGEFNPNMTFVYTTYANILEAYEKYDESVELLEKNLKIRLSTYGKWHRWTCETYYDLANSYVLTENYDRAEEYYKQAIEIGKKINSRQYLGNAKNFLAQLYLDRKIHLDKAEELLLYSLETNSTIYGEKSDLVAENYYQLAILYKLQEDQIKFVDMIDKTLEAANYNQNDLSQVVGPLQAINAIVLLSESYIESFEASRKLSDLDEAYQLIDQKMALIERMLNSFSSDRSRIDFANQYRGIYEDDIGLCWLLYQETFDKAYLQKAFELSEANRNTTLLNGIQGIKFRAYGDIPQDKLDFEQSTIKDLERVKMDIYFEKSSDAPDKKFYRTLLDERISLSNRLDSLHDVFTTNYPKFKNLSSGNRRVKLEQVQEVMDPDTQVIAYFLGDRSLFSFNISKDTITLLRADIADKLVEITKDFKMHLSQRDDINELSYDLYMYLIGQQIRPEKEHIVFVADNILNYIPFESLKTPEGEYLIKDYVISYNSSVRLFTELKNEFFSYETPEYWLGFAPEYDDGDQLQSAQLEIEGIASKTKGRKLIGKDASKENFYLNNKNYSILHLAMHAKIDDENPQYNRLIFQNGDLTASEIYASRSKANLAVLSACNTGFGKIEKGEGVMSMARAFHFSGIPSVVMSLWKVPDQETKSIMIDFYKYLRKGENKSEALRHAKLNYLKENSSGKLSHPYFWSGFVVNGNTDGIEAIGFLYSWGWIALALVGTLLIGFFILRSRRKLL